MGFSDYIKKHGLNHDSEFSELAQAAIENYYLIPYPGKSDNRPNSVNRPLHGALHVTRVARNLEMFLALYKKYAPQLLKNTVGQPFSTREIKLLKLAAIYHDSANTREVFHDEKKHAERFRQDMMQLGFSAEEIEPFALTIQNKDSTYDSNKTIHQKLIHDADCLDIIRLLGDKFEQKRLDCYQDLEGDPLFIEELNQIIDHFKETCSIFVNKDHKKIRQIHLDCEFANNCYETLCDIDNNLLLQHLILKAFSQGYDVSVENIRDQFSILDLYNRASVTDLNIEKSLINLTNEPMKPDEVLNKYVSGGVFVRSIRSTKMDTELRTLKDNETSLNNAGIHNAEDMRRYIGSQEPSNSGQIYTPSGFKWRPSTLLTSNTPISLFGTGNALIIDPDTSVPVYFYKKNVVSERTAHGKFPYTPQQGGYKDRGSITHLKEKLTEMTHRRNGIIPDPNYKYYGKASMSHNEVLVNYAIEDILGIIVGDSKEDASSALVLRAKLKPQEINLYRYTAENGLSLLKLENVVAQATQTEPKLDRMEVSVEEQFLTLSQETQSHLVISDIKEESIIFLCDTDGTDDEVSLDCHNRILMIDGTYFSSDTWHQLEEYIQMLQKKYGFETDNLDRVIDSSLNQEENLMMFESNIENKRVKMKFICADKDSERINKIINKVTSNVDEIILGKPLDHEIQALETLLQTIDTLNITQITTINRTLNTSNQFVYTFKHPTSPKVTCQMEMLNNKPTISMQTSSGTIRSKPTVLLPKIAKAYFEKLSHDINQLLKEPIIQEELSLKNLSGLQFEFEPNSRNPLIAVFPSSKVCHSEGQIEALLELLDIEKPKKIKKYHGTKFEDKLTFIVEDLDALETIKNSLDIIKARNLAQFFKHHIITIEPGEVIGDQSSHRKRI